MCEHCHDIEVNSVSGDRYDPTRTTTLRNAFVREMNAKFDSLVKLVKMVVGEQNVFGIGVQVNVETPGRNAYVFMTDPQKIEAFEIWLHQQVENTILSTGTGKMVGDDVLSSWTNRFIYESYRRGVLRAMIEMKKAGYDVPSVEQLGGVEMLLVTPHTMEKLGVLYTRMFSELKGVTASMEQVISRVLTQGLLQGENPRRLASKLVAAINGAGVGDLGLTDTLGRFIPAKRRAEIIARTEMIRAHHIANIETYRSWDVHGVNIKAEFSSARDNRVCPKCLEIEGQMEDGKKKLYTLDEIEWMIPVHPQCRCIAIPVVVDSTGKRKTYNF